MASWFEIREDPLANIDLLFSLKFAAPKTWIKHQDDFYKKHKLATKGDRHKGTLRHKLHPLFLFPSLASSAVFRWGFWRSCFRFGSISFLLHPARCTILFKHAYDVFLLRIHLISLYTCSSLISFCFTPYGSRTRITCYRGWKSLGCEWLECVLRDWSLIRGNRLADMVALITSEVENWNSNHKPYYV